MSRLTGSDVQSMMEAYNAVYAPQELTEEQVWEEVENWVNSLLEEGYDLSEYTWEEMYESYIEEQGGRGGAAIRNQNVWKPTPSSSGPAGGGMGGRRGGGSSPGGIRPTATPTPQRPASTPKPSPTAPRPAAIAPRPAATAPRPTTPAAKSPAAPRPAAGQTGDKTKDMATWAKANPTLAAKVTPSGTQAGTGQSQMAKQAAELRAMRQRSQERQGVKTEEYDAYDLVLEYLLAEGHADTVEEANYVMLEMDAEMVQDIVETCLDEAVRGAQRSIANRITGNDIRKVTRGNKDVYKKPKSNDDIENKVSGGSQLRKTSETENMNDRRDRERIEANKKSIQRLNAKPGEDDGDYDAGYHGDDDTSGGKRHYSLSRTNRDARRRRASGR
jgi:hypothetical protein